MPDAPSFPRFPGGLQPTDEFIAMRPGTPGVSVDVPGSVPASALVLTDQLGAANGAAPLDSNAKILLANLPAAIAGALQYQGTWDATANSPLLVSGQGTAGYYYIISVAGAATIDGLSNWKVGDWIVFDGSHWDRIDGAAAVSSVAGRIGDVVLGHGDITDFAAAAAAAAPVQTVAGRGGAVALTAADVEGVVAASAIGAPLGVAALDSNGALSEPVLLASIPAQSAALANQVPVTFSSPAAGTDVNRGQTLTIAWAPASGIPDSAGVGFYLMPTGGGARMYARFPRFVSQPNRRLSFSWTVPQNITNPDGSVTALQPGSYQIHAEVFTPGNATRPDYNAEKNYFRTSGNQVLAPDGNPVQFIGTTGMDYLLGGIPDLATSNAVGMVGYSKLTSFLATLVGLNRNIFRMGVGPGVMEFPSLVAKMDAVITAVTALGVVVLLQNDGGTFDENVPWLIFLATRYRTNPFVWINPANEINYNTFRHLQASRGGTAVVPNLPTTDAGNTEVWQDQMLGYTATLRAAGWLNPICVNAVNASRDLSACLPLMEANVADPNWIMSAHVYPMGTYGGVYPITSDQAFPGSDATLLDSYWGSFLGTYPIMVDEIGNTSQTYLEWVTGFITSYLNPALGSRGLVGAIGFEWYGSSPDYNAMRDANWNPTPWGTVFDSNIGHPTAVRRMDMDLMPWLYPTVDGPYSGIGGGVSPALQIA